MSHLVGKMRKQRIESSEISPKNHSKFDVMAVAEVTTTLLHILAQSLGKNRSFTIINSKLTGSRKLFLSVFAR